MYAAVLRARVNVLSACRLGGAEMAPDERPHHHVAAISHDAAVFRVRLKPLRAAVRIPNEPKAEASAPTPAQSGRHEPIVKVLQAVVLALDRLVVLVRTHLTEIPQAQRLVFAVRDDIPAIALCRYVRYALRVADKHARGPC